VNKQLLAIFFTILVNLIGFGIIIPLLPLYAQSMGASPLAIGSLFMAYSVSQMVASPVLGAWSDRWGRRPVLLLSLLGTAVSFAMLALARNIGMLFAARIVDGLSGGNIPTARAYISDITGPRERARSFAWLGAAFGLGFIVGPAMGGALSAFGFAAPAWVAAGLAAVGAAMAWFWLSETVHRAPAEGRSGWHALPAFLRRSPLGTVLAVDWSYWVSAAAYQTTFALFAAQRFGLGVREIGYLLSFAGAVGAVVQLTLVGPAVRRLGERRALAAGLFIASAAFAAIAVVNRVWLLATLVLPASVGTGLASPSLMSLISRTAAPDEQGTVQGVAGTLESLGRAVGPVWGNGLLGLYGEGPALSSVAALLTAAGFVMLSRRGRAVDEMLRSQTFEALSPGPPARLVLHEEGTARESR
jgi:DHA1 family tetracycline resistance protein-like MFS transporter